MAFNQGVLLTFRFGGTIAFFRGLFRRATVSKT
jgi:hypothetical protein